LTVGISCRSCGQEFQRGFCEKQILLCGFGVLDRARFRLRPDGVDAWDGSPKGWREPDEYRPNIDSEAIDSWSTRITVNPSENWSLQDSMAHWHSPEELAPEDNVRRMTASVAYNRPIDRGNWASLLAWGRNQSLVDGKGWQRVLAGIDSKLP
jgi:hypothetical protein